MTPHGGRARTGATCCFEGRLSSAGGGPSITSEMISSPRSSSMPSTRRSSRCTAAHRRGSTAARARAFLCVGHAHVLVCSAWDAHVRQAGLATQQRAGAAQHASTRRRTSSSVLPFLGGSLRNSSASPSTRFMWRSYAMNLGEAAGGGRQAAQE